MSTGPQDLTLNTAAPDPQNRLGMRANDERPDRRTNSEGGAGKQGPDNDDKHGRHNRRVWYSVTYVIIALVALYLFQQFLIGPLLSPSTQLNYSDFKAKVASGQILTAEIGDSQITGTMKNPDPKATGSLNYQTIRKAGEDPDLINQLQAAGVKYSFAPPASPLGGILLNLVPFVLFGALWYYFYQRTAGRAGGGIFGAGKSKATKVESTQVGVTFKDVGGADEAIAELRETIEFLKNPGAFASLGGHIPKGVLLVGPPGTGKTLLAKATAGEAGVAFFESSGSEFVEMFVGVGAARVRDLFKQAREAAPAIVFIDEIDAIGQSRGGAVQPGGGNDEREQTLNQLLAEIDGFKTDADHPVIIMAATNRPEVLDAALLRAGRFDRTVEIGNPDLTGRLQILKIHSKGIKLAPDFDLQRVASMTPGFSGADLANAMNEAALLAARNKGQAVTTKDFDAAIERAVAGVEKKTRVMNETERKRVAYHESGHAKISIIPHARGALGFTMQMPTEDRYLMTEEELTERIAVMLGGRAAEVTVFSSISTGAGDDIQKATELARRMVTEFGMSEKLGSVSYAGRQLQYMNGTMEDNSRLSPRTRVLIDEEVQKIVTEQYERAKTLLGTHREALEKLSQELLEQETVDGSAVQAALNDDRVAGPTVGRTVS
jgi:cell division protease FtsH